MLVIRPIRPEEGLAARRLILGMVYRMFGWEGSLEAGIRRSEEAGHLSDLEDVQANYFQPGGIFLVALDGDRLVGTGAICPFNESTAEIKRLWLLEEYQGRGVGYEMLARLLDYACGHGFQRVRLSTDDRHARAVAFYRRVGFEEIASNTEYEGQISMEMDLPSRSQRRQGNFSSGQAS